MKKKLFILLAILGLVSVAVYFYAYQGHRDIATADADFKVSIASLQNEFTANDSLATAKYQNKVVEVSGLITTIEPETKSIVIDNKVYAQFDSVLPSSLKKDTKTTIKGRFLAYDDLVEEFKMDQSSIVE